MKVIIRKGRLSSSHGDNSLRSQWIFIFLIRFRVRETRRLKEISVSRINKLAIFKKPKSPRKISNKIIKEKKIKERWIQNSNSEYFCFLKKLKRFKAMKSAEALRVRN